MIRAILFDYGGVVSRGGVADDAPNRLARSLQIGFDEAREMLRTGWADFLRGRIDEPEFWQVMESIHGQPITKAQRDIWIGWEEFRPDPLMLELIRQLKQDGYRVGMVSNVLPLSAKLILEHGGYELYDFCILSCEVGLAKPEPAIFELALSKLPGIEPQEVIYIDDQERHLKPAAELGIRTVLAVEPKQIIRDIKKLLKNAK
jgi:putative hydrolase of the HAD superfamily